ncbi:hypothetical protein TRFO_21942 [Tritrichomonas foetus]|uniref:I/LWEQ domain-containing protein n=1 Tax=Tritrichomonas foetus TaxID=1144522 RepID=A0A1J4KIS3_9EUKA|nr:hypothetical protein TRFO_21942 [Tritrichomonas foetus]|eukprot:OHT09213.1 hypothetical protein TRFO_21942 [Tritrichomonas foetus]
MSQQIALEELATGLNQALTPSNVRPVDSEVKLTALAFGQGVSRDIVEKNHLPSETVDSVGHLYATTLFSNSVCFGVPKKNYENCSVTQITYSSSALVFYFDNLDFFIGVIPSFITDFVKVTMQHIKGEVSEEQFTKTAYAFVDYITIIQLLCAGADLEVPNLPAEFQLPQLKSQIDNLCQLALKCIQDGDLLRGIHAACQPTTEQEGVLAASLQNLNNLVPTFHQLFTLLNSKINEQFDTLFGEQAYIDWQLYCKNFTSIISKIIMTAYKVALYSPDTFIIVTQVLQQLANFSFETVNPFMTLLRFRGKFDQFVKSSKEAHDKMGSIFAPLLQAIINIIPKCPQPFAESVNGHLVPLFNELQKLHGEYDSRVEVLIAAMKADRRFSVFQSIGLGENSEVAEAAKATIEITNKIVTQLIKQTSSINEIAESLQKLTVEFETFSKFVVQYTESVQTMTQKVKLIQQRDAINNSLNQFVSSFQVFASTPENSVARLQAGLMCANLLLSLCSLDSHPTIIKQLNSLRQVLAENVTQFVPSNTKLLIEIMSLFMTRSSELPQEIAETFMAIFSIFITQIRESSTTFAANANPNNSTNVINCIHECDILQALLHALTEALNANNIPADLQAAVKLLDMFAYNIRYSADSFRLALQLNFRHLMKSFVSYMIPFVEMVSSAASLQSDEYFTRFSILKQQILDATKIIESKLEKAPIQGVYDQNYLIELHDASRESFAPSITLIKECQEILKLAATPAQIKTAMNNISHTLNTLVTLTPYISAIYYDRKLTLPTLLGFLLKKACDNTNRNLDMLAATLQTNPANAGVVGSQLVNSLCEFASTMDYLDQLHPVAGQVREIANAISQVTVHIALGNNQEQPQLLQLLQNIRQLSDGLQQIIEKYIEDVRGFGRQSAEALKKSQAAAEQKAQVQQDPNVPLFPEGQGILINPATNSKFEGLCIDRIPTQEEIDKLFMDAMTHGNDMMKGLLTGYVNAIKRDVDEFLPLFAQLQREPNNAEILARLNALGTRINGNLASYHECLNFNPENATEDHLKDLLDKFSQLPTVSKNLSAPEFLLNLSAYANANLKDPARAQFSALINEVSSTLATNPELAHTQLELLAQALFSSDPSTLTLTCLNALRDALAQKDAQRISLETQRSLFADKLARILAGTALPQPGSVQDNLNGTSNRIRDANSLSADNQQLMNTLISQFEDLILGDDKDLPDDENEIPDKIMDLSNNVIQLGGQILSDLKKATANDLPSINKLMESLKANALEIANIAVVLASRRQDIPNDVTDENQEEITKLLESIKSFEEGITTTVSSSNKSSALRACGKSNREITMSVGHISELVDSILEVPSSVLQPSIEDYSTHANLLLGDIMKLARMCNIDKNSPTLAPRFAKTMTTLNSHLGQFRTSVERVSHGTDEEQDLKGMLNDLEKLFVELKEPANLKYDIPREGFGLVSEIRRSVADALSQEVVAQPKAVSSLPFRFSVPPTQQFAPASTAEIHPLIVSAASEMQKSLNTISASLNNAKTQPDTILSQLTAFHDTVSKLIIPTDRMISSTWNPQCQNQLHFSRSLLIGSGDSAIDAARSRLLGSDGWRDNVSQFVNAATEALSRTLSASQNAVDAAKADLAVTNEAERELVNAARSVQQSQQRLLSMRTIANEKKISSGEGYLGCDIIEISAPILSTAAKLIETAQAQTRFLLQRDPTLPNQKGMVKTANDLVESLALITVAAESTVNNEPDAISKVLAASNLVSSAVAHFLAEVHQKNGSPELNDAMEKITGSIQGLVKQLRAFGEAAQNAETQRNTDSVAVGKKPLSSMIEKLNAEAKVVEARRALEEAEQKLKKARTQGPK